MSMHEGVEIVCEGGAVATGPPEAARAGAAVLEEGGNAIDAAAAACLACAVMEPQAVDLGGYVLAAVVIEGKTGLVWSVDANTVAPNAATPHMFRTLPVRASHTGHLDINEREYGCTVADDANLYGPLAVSVPGFMAGVGAMWERWGQLQWPRIIAPALSLVEKGMPYSRVLNDILFKREAILRYPSTSKLLFPQGPDRLPSGDDIWLRPDLVRTLNRLAAAGWRDFYSGQIGHTIADFIMSQGGMMTRDDMAAFAPRITEPLTGTYRGVKIHTAIAPNGGFSVLDALADLESQLLPPDSDPSYWDTMAKTLRRMWTTRLADAPLPGTSQYGTVHVATADRTGSLVSATISQGGLFGSCLAVPGTGIILAHGMCRFEPRSGLANSPGPTKRPLNNVCPILIRMADRDVAIGTRGGRRIVSVAVQLAQRIVDDNASAYEAATAPRIHTLTGNPLEISANFDPAIRQALERSDYTIEVPDEVAGAAHGTEFFHATCKIRAGGNTWTAGI